MQQNKDNKICPYCGQNEISFNLEVCVCGKHVGNIKYVNNSETFATNYYSYIGKYHQ